MARWMLVVMVFGTAPVPTGISFDTLQACWSAEEAMRSDYASAYNTWEKWAKTQSLSQDIINNRAKQMLQAGVCVPSAT
jgi:hypothetical protein